MRRRRTGRSGRIPDYASSKKTPHFDVAVAIIFDEAGRLLVCKRPEEAMLGGLWEFPGGKRNPGETLEAACRRTLQEKWNVAIEMDDLVHRISHAYSHFRITMYAFRATIAAGTPHSLTGRAMKWADSAELRALAFSKTGRRLIEHLEKQETARETT